jgi:hypothetical protein
MLNGHPEAQMTISKQTLKQAAVEDVEWRKIYEFIYKTWYSQWRHFPHPDGDSRRYWGRVTLPMTA